MYIKVSIPERNMKKKKGNKNLSSKQNGGQ